MALLPFVVFAISYDWMRVYPNYRVNDIDVAGLYQAEKALFGLTIGGERLTLCEYFNLHHAPFADALAGFFYLCWVPVPILFGLYLYMKGEGCEKDEEKAIELFERAARTEYDGNALYELGYLYENRGETSENLEKAADYYQKAIEMGNENAARRFSHFKKSLFGRWKLIP